MKTLTEYINEHLNMIPSFYKRFGVIIDEADPYDYDKFLVNNQLPICDESYKKFVKLTDMTLNTLPFGLQSTYSDYQKFIYNERLGESLDYRNLIKKLQDEFNFGEILDVVKSKSSSTSFIIKTNDITIKNNPQFISLLSYYSYFINTIGDGYIQLSPYKPTEASDIIYNDCNGMIYHICTIDQLQKIKKYGIVPRNVSTEYIYRPYRRFYIADANKKDIKTELKILYNSLTHGYNRRNSRNKYKVNKDDIVVLIIDLSKSSRKYKFYYDDSASGYHAYFTEETIPPYCVVDVIDYDKINDM